MFDLQFERQFYRIEPLRLVADKARQTQAWSQAYGTRPCLVLVFLGVPGVRAVNPHLIAAGVLARYSATSAAGAARTGRCVLPSYPPRRDP